MSEWIRNAIAAAGLVFTLGSALIGFAWSVKADLATLTAQVANLAGVVTDLRCEAHPQARVCLNRDNGF